MKQRINNILRKFGVEMHGTGYLQALAKGDFKKDAFQAQKEHCKKNNPIIFDVGANIGNTVAAYRQLFPHASIYAFEPFPGSFNVLTDRFGDDKAVHCNQAALSAEAGKKTFYVNHNVDTNSLLAPQNAGLSSDKQVKNINSIEVSTITFDSFCSDNNIEHIDILKMDIQGGELDALKGGYKLLNEKRIELIYSEVFFVEQYILQPVFHDISKFLFDLGYYLQDIYNVVYGKGRIAWADVIFCKK